jgi:hypothetical protein
VHATNRRRQTKRLLGAITIALFSCPITARAQSGALGTDSVTSIANAFFAAVVAGRWSDASRTLDTASLSALRRQSADYVRHWRAARPLTLRQYMEMNPNVSRAVATYQVKQTNERTRELGKALRAYGVEDPDSLLALPMETYAARWLEIRDERWQLRESAQRCGRGSPADVSIAPYRVIASVPGDEVAYVLYDPGAARSPGANDQDPRVPRVMVLHRRGSTWSIIPRDDLIGWGQMVNACG